MEKINFTEMSKKEIKDYISKNEHVEYEDEEGNWVSCREPEWCVPCNVCKAEDELKNRKYIKDSKKPGNVPYVSGSSYFSCPTTDLAVGDFSEYRPYPGSPRFHAEILEISETKKGKIVVVWRKSNTSDAPFIGTYNKNYSLNVTRLYRRA